MNGPGGWFFRATGTWIPAGVLLAAACAKAGYPWSMSDALDRLGITDGTLALGITLVLIGAEAGLGVALLAAPGAPTRRTCAVVLLAFTIVLGVFLSSADPPRCGCLGLVRLFRSATSELVFGIGRNLLLIAGLLAPGPSGTRRQDSSPLGTSSGSRTRHETAGPRGA